jgi:hypothetical protein
MPANKYGKGLYKAGDMKSEMAAERNRDPARKKAAEIITAREGTTRPSGGRAPVKMPAKTPAPKPVQVIRTTQAFKPSPMTKKR